MSSAEDTATSIFNIAIASIFAREILEGSIIIINYRTVIKRSRDWVGERETAAVNTVTRWSIYAVIVAILCILAVALPLQFLSKNFEKKYALIIEAISKIVAAICILQISLKIPTWLGVYPKKSGEVEVGITLREIKFNISWNLWREVAECGIFLLPFFLLDSGTIAIPLSAAVGILIALIFVGFFQYASTRLENKIWLAVLMSGMSAALALGLFVGGCNLLEVVLGATPTVWTMKRQFWSDSRFPMTIIKPFGYSSSRTVLQICAFWIWLFISVFFHYRKYRFAKDKSSQDETHSTVSEKEECNSLDAQDVEYLEKATDANDTVEEV